MGQIRKHVGRRRAIKLFWILILLLVIFAVYESFSPASDSTVATVLIAAASTFTALVIYICNAKKTYVSGCLKFTFSKEHDGVVEMHLKRTCCCRITNLRAIFIAALGEMREYAQFVGATKLEIETPLLSSDDALLFAKRAAKKLGVTYELHKPRTLNRVVSTLAHRTIHKCDEPKPKLRESLSAKLIAHGFTLPVPA